MSVSKIIRRTHMYLALFLTPWIAMYATSTIIMNHGNSVREYYGENPVQYEKEREVPYTATFSDDARERDVAEQILRDLDLMGTYVIRGVPGGGDGMMIMRQDPLDARRILYRPGEEKLIIERLVTRTPVLLTRLHTRRGFRHDFVLEDLWAGSVDLVIIGMIFWVASGIWLWWELSVTRRWGAVSLLAGLAVFCLLLFTA